MLSVVPRVKIICRGSGGVDESRDLLASQFVSRRRFLAQRMDAAMDVGVFGFVVFADRINDDLRLLCRRRVVEINQRLAMDFSIENGELAADLVNIHGRSRAIAQDGCFDWHDGSARTIKDRTIIFIALFRRAGPNP